MMRLEDYLALHACQSPQKIAVVCGGEEYTYAELYQRVQQRAEELTASFSTSDSSLFTLHFPPFLSALPRASTFWWSIWASILRVRQQFPWNTICQPTVTMKSYGCFPTSRYQKILPTCSLPLARRDVQRVSS